MSWSNESDGYDTNCPKHGGYNFDVGWGDCPHCLEEIRLNSPPPSESVDKPTYTYYIDPLDEYYEDDDRPY